MTPAARHPRLLALAAGALAVAAMAVPVLGGAARPSSASAPVTAAESEKPGNGPKSEKPGRGPKADKVPEAPVTRSGRVGTRTDEDGDTVYTLTVGSTVFDLDAGPPWWWGESHPLAGFVGETVTVEGDQAEGSTSIDVRTVDGKVIRQAGRPPWAGGWKVVGERHPGWTQEKADRAADKGDRTTGRPSWAGPKPSPEPEG